MTTQLQFIIIIIIIIIIIMTGQKAVTAYGNVPIPHSTFSVKQGFSWVFRFFLVSLCLKANGEMVPKIPSCHYMLLM